MPSEKEQRRLKALLDAFDGGAVQPEELTQVVDGLIEVITYEKDRLDKVIADTDQGIKSDIKNLTEGIVKANRAIEQMVRDTDDLSKAEINQVRKLVASEVRRLEDSIPEMPEDFDASDLYELLNTQSKSLDSLTTLVAGENIRNALEAIPLEEDKLKIEAIGFLRKELDELRGLLKTTSTNTTAIIAHRLSQIGDVSIAGATNGQVLAYNSTTGLWEAVNQSGGGGSVTVETPSGSVNSSNVTFTVTAEPKWIVSDGITYFSGAGYSLVTLTVTMDVAPSSFIRAII